MHRQRQDAAGLFLGDGEVANGVTQVRRCRLQVDWHGVVDRRADAEVDIETVCDAINGFFA